MTALDSSLDSTAWADVIELRERRLDLLTKALKPIQAAVLVAQTTLAEQVEKRDYLAIQKQQVLSQASQVGSHSVQQIVLAQSRAEYLRLACSEAQLACLAAEQRLIEANNRLRQAELEIVKAKQRLDELYRRERAEQRKIDNRQESIANEELTDDFQAAARQRTLRLIARQSLTSLKEVRHEA
jgi:hypothetical protein